jgi:hypothetical protein
LAGGVAGGFGVEIEGDAVDGFGRQDDEFALRKELRGLVDADGSGRQDGVGGEGSGGRGRGRHGGFLRVRMDKTVAWAAVRGQWVVG